MSRAGSRIGTTTQQTCERLFQFQAESIVVAPSSHQSWIGNLGMGVRDRQGARANVRSITSRWRPADSFMAATAVSDSTGGPTTQKLLPWARPRATTTGARPMAGRASDVRYRITKPTRFWSE